MSFACFLSSGRPNTEGSTEIKFNGVSSCWYPHQEV